MALSTDGVMGNICLIGITKKGGSEVQFAAYIDRESVDPAEGDKDGASATLANGGRVWKQTPQADNEINLKLYEIDINVDSSLAQLFAGTTDASAPLESVNTHTQDLFQVVFLWTDDSTAATASGVTASGSYSRRLAFKDVRITGYKEPTEDNNQVVNVTMKGPAFARDATGLVTRQSVQSGDGVGLSAFPAYS